MDFWAEWCSFEKHIQAKGSSVACSPYNIMVGRFIASIYDLDGIPWVIYQSFNHSLLKCTTP